MASNGIGSGDTPVVEEVDYEVCDHCAKSVEECDEEEECVGGLIREGEVFAERLGHIQQWSAFFLEATESWSGVLGQELAYLFAAMAEGSKIDVSPDHPFLPILKEHGVPADDSIYLYLNVVENTEELEANESVASG